MDRCCNFSNHNLSFDERCDILRKTPISLNMSYNERLLILKRRFGI